MNETSDWQWSEEKTSILFYFMNNPENYGVRLIRSGEHTGNWPVHVSVTDKTGVPIHHWATHSEGAFVFSGSTLVYSLHKPDSNGCTLVGYDLEKREQIWKTELEGAGAIDHSKYRNQINLVVDDQQVTVFGSESLGQYIEKVDLQTGKTVSNVVGTGAGKKF